MIPTTGKPLPLTMTPVQPSPLTATVRLVSHSWGTGIAMDCAYGQEPEGADYGDVDELAMVAVARTPTSTSPGSSEPGSRSVTTIP